MHKCEICCMHLTNVPMILKCANISQRCCGFWNFTDWIGENSLLEANKTFKYHSEPIHPPTQWMVSCCDRNLTG